jgi:hypothetical protein
MNSVLAFLLVIGVFTSPILLYLVMLLIRRVVSGKNAEMRQTARRQLKYSDVYAQEAAKKAAKEARRQRGSS